MHQNSYAEKKRKKKFFTQLVERNKRGLKKRRQRFSLYLHRETKALTPSNLKMLTIKSIRDVKFKKEQLIQISEQRDPLVRPL